MNRLCAAVFLLKFFLLVLIPESKAADDIRKPNNLRLSPLGIQSMPYRSFRIQIFQGDVDDGAPSAGRYFYSPIVLLDHRSAVSHFNNATGTAELRFVVHLWDDALEVRLAKYLQNVLKKDISKNNLEIVPFEKIAMEFDNINKQPLEYRKLNMQRMLFRYRQEKYVWLRVNCPSIHKCQQMAEGMKLNAAQFSNMQLKFILGPQKKQLKDITVSQADIAFGKFFSRIELKFRRQHYALLITSDAKRLVFEAVDKIIATNFEDNEVITDDSNIYPLLEQQLFSREECSHSFNDWNSIYWRIENIIGLDKLAITVNQLYNKSDSYGQQKLRDAFNPITFQDSPEIDFEDLFEDFLFTTEISLAHLLRNRIEIEDRGSSNNKLFAVNATENADGKTFVFLNASVLKIANEKEINTKNKKHQRLEVKCLHPNPMSADNWSERAIFINCSDTDSISNQEGFHFIHNILDQRDWTTTFKEFLERKKMQVLQILKAGEHVLKWTGREFVYNINVLSRLHLAKVRNHRVDTAFMKLSIPFVEASTVINVNIDDKFYWTPETDMQERLEAAVRVIGNRFQQIETKIYSNELTTKDFQSKLRDHISRYNYFQENTTRRVEQLEIKMQEQKRAHHKLLKDAQTNHSMLVTKMENETIVLTLLEESLRNEIKLFNEIGKQNIEKLLGQVNRGVVLDRMPSSCQDLWMVGHSHTGYYFITSSNSQYPVELVYCDMKDRRSNLITPSSHFSTKIPMEDLGIPDANQKWIGYSDFKTAPVYFYVQRYTTFSKTGAVIPFQSEMLNVGGAMNLPEGTFTAPTSGIYNFAFSGLLAPKFYFVLVTLQVNGKQVGSAYSGTPENDKLVYRPTTLSLHSTLELKRGDKVRLYLDSGAVGAEIPCEHCTHFSGMLLAEYRRN